MATGTVKKELLRIAKEHGGTLRPADVVEAARPKSSPLHSKFEWSDNKAAEAYRLWQARQLISVTVEYLTEDDKEPTQVFVSLTSDRRTDGGYRALTAVLSQEETREQLLEDSFAEMKSFQLKYRRLRELVGVFVAMQEAERKRRGKK